jgi:ankyrin repeat protein
VAAQKTNFQIFKFIFEKAKDKNPKDEEGDTSLHVAAWFGNFEIFKFIFEGMQKGQNKNPKNINGRTPLHNATETGRLAICSLIILITFTKKTKREIPHLISLMEMKAYIKQSDS